MSQTLIADFERTYRRKVPDVRPGYTVRVHQKFTEGGKERSQIFEGEVIKISSGSGVSKTFTVRKIVDNVGVEKIFPFHAPNVIKIEVKKISKVRRAKLYYLRERTGKAAKLYEDRLSTREFLEEAEKAEKDRKAKEVPKAEESEPKGAKTPSDEKKQEKA